MIDRRQFLWSSGGGLGGIAASWLLRHQDRAGTHHAPRAKRVVQLFMSGAASQCDLFDYKPKLIEKNGTKFDPGGKVELFQSNPGSVMQSPWGWRPGGESGIWLSDLVPCLRECVDDIAFLNGMVSKSNVHGPATFLQSNGFVLPGFPSLGSWISYGLGSLNDNLPTFVVLPDARGFAPNGPRNWAAAFLPAAHQGTMIRPDRDEPIADLFPPSSLRPDEAAELGGRELLARLNREHATARPDDSRLNARLRSFEMAASLQLAAPEVLAIDSEPEHIRRLYGLDDPRCDEFGRRCLIARRLLERDVRFIQIWSGADNGHPRRNWDSHENLHKDHQDMGTSMDRPTAALLVDLKQRGLLDDTIIYWTTEFGRMPCGQGNKGRDHNPFGFTSWLAGGGIRGGVQHGATDEWSFRAVDDVTYGYDVHATILHLLGIDHERLTVRVGGIDRRVTDVHGHVIDPILA